MDYSKYIIHRSATIKDALIALNYLSGDILTLFVIDEEDRLIGTLTDGDIRRKLIDGYSLQEHIELVMNRNFRYVEESNNDVKQIKYYKEKGIE